MSRVKEKLMLDISHWNNFPDNIDHQFVMVKLTEGIGYVDPKACEHIKECAANNTPVGVYHFVRADLNGNSLREVEHFINNVKLYSNVEVIALDVEGASLRVPGIEGIIQQFVKLLMSEFPNKKVVVYCSANEAKRFSECGCELWVADWSSATIEDSSNKYGFNVEHVWAWQFTPNYNGAGYDGSYIFKSLDGGDFITELVALLDKYNIR